MPSLNGMHTSMAKPTITATKRNSIYIRAGIDRAVKRRASRACTACRARKVRCDVTKNDDKCTNCRLDNVECIVVASRRGRTDRHARVSRSFSPDDPGPGQGPGPDPGLRKNSTPKIVNTTPLSIASILSPSVSGHLPISVTFDVDKDDARKETEPTPGSGDGNVSFEDTDGAAGDLRQLPAEVHELQNASHPMQQILPTFMKLPKRLSDEDLDFLGRKNAFVVPAPDLRKEIFEGYLYAVHPFMPMLDIATFSHAVLDERASRCISLLLFQAVMFAGIHALKPDSVRRLGFNSVKQAREVFFNRVRLLYEFEIEPDNAAILQALILMSNWYGKWDERKHTWHWTGEAYDLARNMGLHREPTDRFPSEHAKRSRRRLWWSLYTRDRLISLGTRRPMRIRDDEVGVSLLTLEDFDLEELKSVYRSHSIRQGTGETVSLARMCVQVVELCVIVGHVVSSQYTVLSTLPDLPSTMMVIPRSDPDNTEDLERCDLELSEWYEDLDRNVRGATSAPSFTDPDSCCAVHWQVIYLIYLTVVNVLHRAQALRSPSQSPDVQKTQSASKVKVKDTARSLTKSLQTMLRHDQVRFLGPFGVTSLVAASLSHMLDVSADDEDMRDASAFRLSQTLQVLQSLREGWASADAAVSFIATVTRRAGLLVPVSGATGDDPAAKELTTKQQRSTRRGAIRSLPRFSSSHNGMRDTINDESREMLPPGQASSYPPLDEAGQIQSQNLGMSSTLLDGNMPSPSPSGALSGSTRAPVYGSNNIMSNNPTLLSDQYGNQGAETYLEGAPAAALQVPFWDWNTDTDGGMDLDSMAFNYDFYSNTTFQMI